MCHTAVCQSVNKAVSELVIQFNQSLLLCCFVGEET